MLMAHGSGTIVTDEILIGSTAMTDETLAALPTPLARGRLHQPVPHRQLVAALRAEASRHGHDVTRQQLALTRSGHRLFGVMDLSARSESRGFVIGFRNSTDESLAIRIVAGARVFVCDNLALSGDLIALHRRNTTKLDLEAAVHDGFLRYLTHARALEDRIVTLETAALPTAAAKALLFDVFAHRVLPLRLFPFVTRAYFNPDESMPDCHPKTRWGLLNACTRALKRLPPTRAFSANLALGRLFGLGQLVQ